MKGDRQKSSLQNIAKLLKNLREEVDFCLKNNVSEDLVEPLSQELKHLLKLVEAEEKGDKGIQLDVDKGSKKFKEKIIKVSALQNSDYTGVSVEDTGVGMDKKTLSKLLKATSL